MRENLAHDLRLLLVTDDATLEGRDVLAVCLAAVSGGVSAVQLRLKRASDRELCALAKTLVERLPVPVLINDRLDIALAAGAAGVHLGPDDLPPASARGIVPPGFIIGASVGSEPEVARGALADYWGIGPLRHSATKPEAGAGLGWSGAAAWLTRSAGRPCVVIGGVTPEDVPVALDAGFAGVAVVSGILGAADPRSAAERYR